MSEYIDIQKALIAINEFYHDPKIDIVLKEIPPADVRPVVRGEWIPARTNMGVIYKCSICGQLSTSTNFCHKCGADMRGESK